MNTRKVTVTKEDGSTVNLVVLQPSVAVQKEGQKYYNNAFTDALKSKAIVRARLDDLLVEQGLWDDVKQKRYENMQNQLNENELKLAKGGISLSQAKELALDMKRLRADIRELISVRTSLDNNTAEGQADNARFNFYVSACTMKEDGKTRFFQNYEDFMSRSDSQEAIDAASELANMIYKLDKNFEANLPENKFLKTYKFVDDNLRFIDKNGRRVDSEGRLVNEEGRYINEAGELVDKRGNRVDEKGNYVVDFVPFVDDEGKPVVLEAQAETTETAVEPETTEEVPKTEE